MTSPQPPRSAGTGLTAVAAAVDALAEALAHEAAALTGGDPEVLFRAVETKRRALEHLETLNGGTTAAQLLQRAREGDEVAMALAARLKDCAQRNFANGSALIAARRHNERLLAALGRPARQPVYGTHGEPEATAAQRTLGTA